MFNPCFSGEAIVEVTNDGVHYSGGDDLDPYFILATIRELEEEPKIIYESFSNFIVPSTFAVYTYVYPRYVRCYILYIYHYILYI
jgi:hypothetical protein